VNTEAARARRAQRLSQKEPTPPRRKDPEPTTTNEQLPNPWLFDTQELINALDQIRETIMRIPYATHEVHLRTLAARDEVWRLREYLRELMRIQREMQRSFAQRASDAATHKETARKVAFSVRS